MKNWKKSGKQNAYIVAMAVPTVFALLLSLTLLGAFSSPSLIGEASQIDNSVGETIIVYEIHYHNTTVTYHIHHNTNATEESG